MSMLGNSTFTSVQNQLGQLSYLDVSELRVVNATIGSLTITGDLIISGSITLTGDLIIDGQILAADRSPSLPSYSFKLNPTSGIYYNNASFAQPAPLTPGVAIATGGSSQFQIGGSGEGAALNSGQFFTQTGFVGTPSYSFLSPSNGTGMYLPATNVIGFSANSTKEVEISSINHVSLLEGSAGNPSLNFGLSAGADIGTGMYLPAAGVIGFSAATIKEVEISSTNHVSLLAGLLGTPSLNFGLMGANFFSTGIFRDHSISDNGAVGIVSGGTSIANFWDGQGAGPIGHKAGLTIGTSILPLALVRSSGVFTNSWEDGHMGNSSALIFTPTDFMIANPQIGAGEGAITTGFLNVCSTGLGWSQPSGGRWGVPCLGTATVADVIVATKLIPKGFTIIATDTITIHGTTSIITTRVAVGCRNINNPTAGGTLGNPAQLVAYQFNTPTALTNIEELNGEVPVGNGTNMIIIYIDPGQKLTNDSGGITGATITMSRV